MAAGRPAAGHQLPWETVVGAVVGAVTAAATRTATATAVQFIKPVTRLGHEMTSFVRRLEMS